MIINDYKWLFSSISTEHLETLYCECAAVSQIFVAADSLQSYVVRKAHMKKKVASNYD